MTPLVGVERVSAAFGLPDVTVTAEDSVAAQGIQVTQGKWEYRSAADVAFRFTVVTARFTTDRPDTEAVVRGAAGFGDPGLTPSRWLTGIGEHAAVSRTVEGVGVAAAAMRGADIVLLVAYTSPGTVPDEVLVELAGEAFVSSWGGS